MADHESPDQEGLGRTPLSRRRIIGLGGAAATAGLGFSSLLSSTAGAAEADHALGDLVDVTTTGQTTGDQLMFDGTTWAPEAVPEIVAGSGIEIVTVGGVSTIATTAPAVPLTIVSFSASGNWTVPSTATLAIFQAWGAGGGGGSGRRGAPSTVRFGGGSGAAGCYTERHQGLATLRGQTIPITIGQGGAGGQAVTTDDTDGSDGQPGGSTLIGSGNYGTLVSVSGGGGGKGGTAIGGNPGGLAFAQGTYPGMPGQPGAGDAPHPYGGVEGFLLLMDWNNFDYTPATPTTPASSKSSALKRAPAGAGGGGGGLTAANVSAKGCAGVASWDSVPRYLQGTAGTSGSVDGKDYAEHPPNLRPAGYTFGGGVGGGGGWASTGANSGRGGDGSPRGGGGGGGGAAQNSHLSGAGGKGGLGFVRILVF